MTEREIKDIKYVYDSNEDAVVFIKKVTINGVFVEADACILYGNGTSAFDAVFDLGCTNDELMDETYGEDEWLDFPDSKVDFILVDGLAVITKTEAETFFDKAISKLKKVLTYAKDKNRNNMWVARNKNGSFSISDCKLVRGYVSGTCPTDNDGNPVENTWVCPDGSTPDIVWMNLIPNIKWEDEPIEIKITI